MEMVEYVLKLLSEVKQPPQEYGWYEEAPLPPPLLERLLTPLLRAISLLSQIVWYAFCVLGAVLFLILLTAIACVFYQS
jgi:hypothetical protein